MPIDLSNYVTVQDRITEFWEKYPDGRIATHLQSDPQDFSKCRYSADIYRHKDDMFPTVTGWAFELAGKGMVNTTSHEENCETSAIGRALANMGFATSQADRPSREEMQKVERMHQEIATQQQPGITTVKPPPSRISPIRPKREQAERQPDGPFYEDGEQKVFPPDVCRQHGKTTMAALNEYLIDKGFNGGNKGEIVSELEQTYTIAIGSTRGKNQYGDPDLYPGELYNIAHHLIDGEQPALRMEADE